MIKYCKQDWFFSPLDTNQGGALPDGAGQWFSQVIQKSKYFRKV